MIRFRGLLSLVLISGVSLLIYVLIQHHAHTAVSRSLSPLLQEAGKPLKSVDRAISHVFPVDAIDEKMLGDEIKSQLSIHQNNEETVRYLNSLITTLATNKAKPFDYEVFLITGSPNAFAFPGGAICITNEMMDLLETEAELVSVLGHEIGHIERGHLFDAAREEMLRRKIGEISPAIFASELIHKMAAITFSATQEDEADEYGFRLLIREKYDPLAASVVFEKLAKEHQQTSQLLDFFSSHPPTELRIEKFRSRAILWKANHLDARWYVGKSNYSTRSTRYENDDPVEWQ